MGMLPDKLQISKIKRYTAGAFVYYLYSYFLLTAFAQIAQQGIFSGQESIKTSKDVGLFDFCGHYFVEFLSLVISSYLAATFMGWVINTSSKWKPIFITIFTTLPALIVGSLIIFKLWGQYEQESDLFYTGIAYVIFSFVNPFIVVLGTRINYNFARSFFRFGKIHLLWIWVPLSTYIPKLLFLLMLNLLKDIVSFFDIIPSFNFREMFQEFISIAFLSVSISLIKYPLKYSLKVMNKEVFVGINSFYRLMITWGILILGFYAILGFVYGTDYITKYFNVFD